jgi:hypothetical protein
MFFQQYDGTSWVFLGALDSSNHLWAPPVGGGAATIASSSGVADIWANVASSITVSGTNAIAALANADAVPGTVKVVTASGAFTLTNGTALGLPSGANITAAAGDRFLAVALTNTIVAVFAYTRADGSAIVNPSVPMGTAIYGIYGTIPPKTVYGTGQALSCASYPGYLAAVTRAQTGTLTAGNNTITSVGNTAGLGAGIPLEGTGIPSGATIASVTSSTIVMSTTATASGAQTVTAFPPGYKIGGDSTTVGVMDCRGKVIAGRDPSSTNLIGATALNSSQGSKNKMLLRSDLPNVSPIFTGSTGGVSVTSPSRAVQANNTVLVSTASGGALGMDGGATVGTLTSAGTFTPAGAIQDINGAVTQTAQPTVIAECVVVVLP